MFLEIYLLIRLCWVLVVTCRIFPAACGIFGHVGSRSVTRGQTQAPGVGRTLTTGPSGKSLCLCLLKNGYCVRSVTLCMGISQNGGIQRKPSVMLSSEKWLESHFPPGTLSFLLKFLSWICVIFIRKMKIVISSERWCVCLVPCRPCFHQITLGLSRLQSATKCSCSFNLLIRSTNI